MSNESVGKCLRKIVADENKDIFKDARPLDLTREQLAIRLDYGLCNICSGYNLQCKMYKTEDKPEGAHA